MIKFSPEYFEFHRSDWHLAESVPRADAATYRALNHCWFVDKDYVYFQGGRLKHADLANFAALNEMYAKDRHKVYSKSGVAGCVGDPATFEALDEGFFAGHYDRVCYSGYARDGRAVYFSEYGGAAPMTVRGADPKTFVSLGYLYGKDARAGYYGGKLIAASTPERFQVLDELYARDARGVYYAGRPVAGANPDAFEIFAGYHGRDDRHVYDRGQIIPSADPESYEVLDDTCLARDRNHVFVSGKIQSHIDIASFEFLGHDYFADRKGVYWRGKRVNGADRATFKTVGYRSARDARSEYQEDKKQRDDVQQAFPPGWQGKAQRHVMWMMLWEIVRRLPLLLKALFARRSASGVSSAPAREPDLLLLAETLAGGDAEALAAVRLAIRDAEAFVQAYKDVEPFVDEPDYASLLEGLEDPAELSAIRVLEEVYCARNLLGAIDWRAETHETIGNVDPMLRRHGIRDFDWSFVDVLAEKGDGTELRNNNFLSLLRDRLHPLGLTLAHVNRFDDSYRMAVLRLEEFAKINWMVDPEVFSISDEFGSDSSYLRGKRLLGMAG